MLKGEEFLEGPLPKDCPPESAYNPKEEVFLRFVKEIPPLMNDFHSYFKIKGDKPPDVSLCQAKSVSLFKTIKSYHKLKKLPKFKKSIMIIITLPEFSGKVSKTGQDHFSWWIYKEFDPITQSNYTEYEVEKGN
ncbi:MAG: hypothetical protein H8D42_04995 [Candidatus Marinimicrobia bacterium]|nr:hypothetical protein [Candidatus Neomarinimicrobiota bacterium]